MSIFSCSLKWGSVGKGRILMTIFREPEIPCKNTEVVGTDDDMLKPDLN